MECYAHEVTRENEEDKLITQIKVVNEVYSRLITTFKLLDSEPTAVDAIYDMLVKHYIYICLIGLTERKELICI